MREIAATIQAAQYEVMISSPKKHVIVQGGAGTGKTAVALHRVSWLLYTEQGKITPADVLIVGPSERFNTYIRSVLPSLGDAGVRQATLSELGPVSAQGRVEDDEVGEGEGGYALGAGAQACSLLESEGRGRGERLTECRSWARQRTFRAL